VARAKRTDRTEARRRYRAEQAAAGGDPTTDVVVDAAPAKGRSTASRAAAPAPAARPGIVASFKAAYRPVDLRGDLRAAPMVLTHWGVLAAIGVTILSGVLFVVTYSGAVASIPVGDKEALQGVIAANPLPASIFGALVLTPPPMIGAFLIGFTAKRASWLGGLFYGIVVFLTFVIVLATPAGRVVMLDQPTDAGIAQMATLSPMGAALFASAAAWYRRFLDLANPNRNQPRAKQGAKQGGSSSAKKTASSSARR
jgi:hypothetical protein